METNWTKPVSVALYENQSPNGLVLKTGKHTLRTRINAKGHIEMQIIGPDNVEIRGVKLLKESGTSEYLLLLVE